MEQFLEFIEFNQYNLPLLIELIAAYILILWLAVVAWTLKDITTRSNNFLVIILTVVLVTVGNIPGLVLYLLLRPSQTIEESQNKELFYSSIVDKKISACDSCGCLVRTDYKFCPDCGHALMLQCQECRRQINPTWKYCVYCDTKLAPNTLGGSAVLGLVGMGANVRKFFSSIFEFNLRYVRDSASNIKSAERRYVTAAKKKSTMTASAATKKSKSRTSKSSGKSDSKSNGKPKRAGRPKGSKDNKPRKKRADAGRKRGSYSK
ncbi:MAG: zinc ribbon domain-containing protein [Candidatus Dojkabacteria bacterium]